MTVSDIGSGGVHGAIEATADNVFHPLSDPEKDLARELFLRLVDITGDTIARRRIRRRDLLSNDNTRTNEIERLINDFAEARLISLDDDTVEIAHDAVLAAWPKLREWIDEDHAGLRAEQRLAEAASIGIKRSGISRLCTAALVSPPFTNGSQVVVKTSLVSPRSSTTRVFASPGAALAAFTGSLPYSR